MLRGGRFSLVLERLPAGFSPGRSRGEMSVSLLQPCLLGQQPAMKVGQDSPEMLYIGAVFGGFFFHF